MKCATTFCPIVAVIASILTFDRVFAAPPKPVAVKSGGGRTLLKIDQEYIASLGGDEAALKRGMKVDLYLQTGKKLESVEITELLPGKQKNSIKTLSCS